MTEKLERALKRMAMQTELSAMREVGNSAKEGTRSEKTSELVLPTAREQEQNKNILFRKIESGPLEGLTLLPSSLEDAARTAGYTAERMGSTLLGGVETFTDLLGSGIGKAIQGVTSVGGLFPNAVSEWGEDVAEHFLNTSPTQAWEESIERRYDPSQGARNVTGVGQTIMQMVPAIRAASAVSTAGNVVNAAQAASRGANVGRAIMGVQAAGNAASEAAAEGADTNQALAYGLTSGLLETTIESLAGGIPFLGRGKIGEIADAVRANPIVSRVLDIAGEGGEEALSTVLSPYLKRAIYDPDAESATAEEIAQSAVLGAVAAGVLQAGLELPTAVSNTVSDIRRVRQEVGSNQDIIDRANQRIARDAQARRETANPLLPRLQAVGDVQSDSQIGQRDNRLYLPGVDNTSIAGYDVNTSNNPTGGADNGRGTEALTAREGIHGAALQTRIPRTEETYRGRMGGVLEEGGRVQQPEPWAKGHIISTPSAQAQNAASRAKQYFSDVFVVDDAVLKARNQNAWAVTSGGKIYISDAVPAELADAVGYHESVHAIRQQNNEAYHRFLSDESSLFDRSSETSKDLLDLVVDTRFPGKSIMDLTPEGAALAYDELNALVWGYHKADPENARAQFSDVFLDYDSYIRELDGIMEGAAAEQGVVRPEGSVGVPAGRVNDYGPNTVGAAQISPWGQFQASATEFFPEGANAAREVDMPTTDPQGRPIRKTAATAMGARAIPEEALADIQNMVLRGELSYNKVSDKSSIDRAVRTIREKGYQGALEEFRSDVQRGVVSKDMATLGQQLLVNAANAGDSRTTAELLSLYAQMETTAGQAVQAASILRKLDPSDQLYAAQRTVSDLEKALRKNYKDLEITIDQALLDEFAAQTTQEGRDAVMDRIYQNVADQVPSTWRDKWNAWRYLAMLANPRTHIRNVAGNLFFQPLRIVKDRTAAAIEAGLSKAGVNIERTKSFAASHDLYKAAWNDWQNVKDVLSGNKYDDVRSEINSRRRVFRTAPLEAARTGNSWALEFEDSIFKRITYADALAGYLQANGVSAEQVRNNTVDAQLMARARDYAGQEALRATYQDRNMVSNKVVEVARALGPFGEAVLPFKRTPANILVRGLEYSPAGLAKALTADLVQVKQGKISAAQAIDHIAAGLTGSGLFALGAYLFSEGLVTSGGGDDENQDRLNDLTGQQNYALNLPGGGNVTLDWLAPEALPFFMGVELMDSLGQNGNTSESIMNALQSISEPMLELSMLQSLNDIIDSVSFSENKLGAMAASSVISYFTQAIPTIGGQIERSLEDTRMSTYTDKNLKLPTDVQYALGRASARIPLPYVDYQQIPYIDAWGRREDSGPLWLRTANNFLNPAYTSNSEVTPVDEEIQRLYDETGESGVVPDRPQRYITVNGERIDLSAEQYTQYAEERGQMQFSMLEGLVDSSAYQRLSDTDKAAIVSDVYSYADAVAKSHISDYEPEGWIAKVVESGADPAEYILYKHSLTDGMTLKERSAALERSGITGREKTDLLLAENPDWTGKAREYGVSDRVYVEFKVATSDVSADKDEDGKSVSGSKKKKVMDIIDGMDVSDEIKDRLYYAAGYTESTIDDAPWR